jgi:hypothetical protein
MLAKIYEERYGCQLLEHNDVQEEELIIVEDAELPVLEKKLSDLLKKIYVRLTALEKRSQTCNISSTIFVEFASASSLFSALTYDEMENHYTEMFGDSTIALRSLNDFQRIFDSLQAFQYCKMHNVTLDKYETEYKPRLEFKSIRLTGKGLCTREALKRLHMTYQIYEPPCLMNMRFTPDNVVSPRAMIPKFSNARRFSEGHLRRPMTTGSRDMFGSHGRNLRQRSRPATVDSLRTNNSAPFSVVDFMDDCWATTTSIPIKVDEFRDNEMTTLSKSTEFDIKLQDTEALTSINHISFDMGKQMSKQYSPKQKQYVLDALTALPQNEALRAVYNKIQEEVEYENDATNKIHHACLHFEHSHAQWLAMKLEQHVVSPELKATAPNRSPKSTNHSFRSSFSRQTKHHRRLQEGSKKDADQNGGTESNRGNGRMDSYQIQAVHSQGAVKLKERQGKRTKVVDLIDSERT